MKKTIVLFLLIFPLYLITAQIIKGHGIKARNTDKTKPSRIGSLLHFFRTLHNNTISEKKFIVNHVVKIPNPK